jgi:alpha-glucosidase
LNDGIIVGVQGGSEVTQEKLAQLTSQTDVAAVWIQDWVGQRTTSFGKQLWWNWRLDEDHYSDYTAWQSRLQDQGVRVLTYLNPSLVPDPNEASNDLHRLMFENDGFVVNGEGVPIEFLNSSFDSNLLDLANDDAMEVWVDTVSERLKSLNVSGWMADFGENFPFVEGHNGYPVLWSKWNQVLAERMGLSEPFIFHRSAYVGSAEVSGAFWLGDQMVDWSSQDGIKSAVTGLLTSGMSGMPVTHSDIGGYTTIDHPLRSVTRSRELLARWLELNSFGLIMRSHEGNLPELNSQIYDQEMLPHVRSAVARFVSLSDYRNRLYEEMEASGVPPIRHPLLEYPQISRFWGMRFEQFFLGSELMVVPVLNPGQSRVDVILPPGAWRLLGSHGVYQGASGGRLINLSAPLGSPVALVMVGSELDRSMSEH